MEVRGVDQQKYWSGRALTYGHQYGLDKPSTLLKIRRKVGLMSKYIDFDVPNIIEFGCGTGLYTKEFYRMNHKLIATDISREMIEVARQYCPEVTYRQIDTRQMKLPSESYDVAVSAFLLQHVDCSKVLPEMCRILRKGGYLGAFVPNLINPWHLCRAKVQLYRHITREISQSVDYARWEWGKLLEGYGLKLICAKPIEFTSPYLPQSVLSVCTKVSEVLEALPIVKELAGTIMVVAQRKS